MDVFIEQIIARKAGIRGSVLKLFLFAGMAILCTFFLIIAVSFSAAPMLPMVALAAIPGVIWLGINLIKGLGIEYEYILTNKDLDIDKIIGQRRRKRMITLNLLNTEEFNLYQENLSLETLNADVTVSAHDNTYVNMWYLAVKHDSYGKVILLFSPNDTFIMKLNKELPMRVRNKKIADNENT